MGHIQDTYETHPIFQKPSTFLLFIEALADGLEKEVGREGLLQKEAAAFVKELGVFAGDVGAERLLDRAPGNSENHAKAAMNLPPNRGWLVCRRPEAIWGFEKLPIQSAILATPDRFNDAADSNQLKLFTF